MSNSVLRRAYEESWNVRDPEVFERLDAAIPAVQQNIDALRPSCCKLAMRKVGVHFQKQRYYCTLCGRTRYAEAVRSKSNEKIRRGPANLTAA
jgi:transposase-like protein